MFFTDSGSESVDTALKMALAYHRARGEGQRTRLIGRERGYHGVNFGGISVGGIAGNRKSSARCWAASTTCATRTTWSRTRSRAACPSTAPSSPTTSSDRPLHDASTIAAVIVEPVAGSTGVLIPPKGYLQRLREICDKHGILLIFDEVITGFGRIGQPFAAQLRRHARPDDARQGPDQRRGADGRGGREAAIHDTFMTGPEHLIEFSHGYTYSAHPLACAAGLATLETYADEGLLTRAGEMGRLFAEALHSLEGCPT